MKRTLTAVAVMSLMAATALAQGTIDFRNRITGVLDAPITKKSDGTRVADATYLVQLYFGAVGTAEDSLTAVSAPAVLFRTGAGAGYWNYGTDFTRALTGIAPGAQALVQVRAWNTTAGATYDLAKANNGIDSWGRSAVLTITTGGAGSPPSVPAALTGLGAFQVVPEPTTLALGALGLAGLLAIRRRK